MLGAGLPSEPAGGLEGNESARSAPTREAARDVEAEVLSTNGAEEWSSRPEPGLPRLSAVAAVPSPCDSTAAPLRSSQQWHARDGPRARRRSLRARTVRTGRQPRRLLAAGLRVATTGRVPRGRRETLHPSRAAQRAEHCFDPAAERSFFTPQVRRASRSRPGRDQCPGRAGLPRRASNADGVDQGDRGRRRVVRRQDARAGDFLRSEAQPVGCYQRAAQLRSTSIRVTAGTRSRSGARR